VNQDLATAVYSVCDQAHVEALKRLACREGCGDLLWWHDDEHTVGECSVALSLIESATPLVEFELKGANLDGRELEIWAKDPAAVVEFVDELCLKQGVEPVSERAFSNAGSGEEVVLTPNSLGLKK